MTAQKVLPPTKRLKESLGKLKKCLFRSFNFQHLNQSQNVKEDTILLFTPKNKFKGDVFKTFAISFSYIDKPAHEHTVTVSIKPVNYTDLIPNSYGNEWDAYEKREKRQALNAEIIYSPEYTIDQFKEILNNLLYTLGALSSAGATIPPDNVIEIIDRECLTNKLTVSDEANIAATQIRKDIFAQQQAFEQAENLLHDSTQAYTETKASVQTSLKRTKEYQHIAALEQQLADAKQALSEKELSIAKDKRLPELKAENKNASKDYQAHKRELLTLIEKRIQDKPVRLHSLLKIELSTLTLPTRN